MTTSAREATTHLFGLLRREHHALAEFLVALAVFDREKRWVELGHSSLFCLLVRELELSKGAAYYRKTAAELVQRFPEVLEALREGKLCLTSIVELSKVITPENRAEVLPRFFHLSKRQAKEVTAEILPAAAPPMRTVITAVRAEDVEPAPALVAPGPVPLSSGSIGDVPVHPANLAYANASVPDVVSARARPRVQPLEVQPLTAELSRVHLTVSRRLLDKLAKARDALSHSHPGASEETILEVGLDLIVQRHAKRRGIGAKPRRTTRAAQAPASPEAAPSPPPERSRHVPAAVWRSVWERDRGCCAWPLEGAGVCGSIVRVQLDHIEGFALGAGTTVEETRLLCAFHQDVHARQLYGDDLMNRFTAPKGGRCSEPVAAWAGDLLGSGIVSSQRPGSTQPFTGSTQRPSRRLFTHAQADRSRVLTLATRLPGKSDAAHSGWNEGRRRSGSLEIRHVGARRWKSEQAEGLRAVLASEIARGHRGSSLVAFSRGTWWSTVEPIEEPVAGARVMA